MGTFVSSNVNDVLDSITNGVCNAISSIDSSAVCSGVTLVQTASRRRRSLAAGEWTATVEVTASSSSNRDAAFAYFNDDANSDALTNAIASSLQTDGLGAAIASGSNLDSESSASNVSDDSSSSDNSLVIIAAAVGGLVVVVVLIVVIYLARLRNNDRLSSRILKLQCVRQRVGVVVIKTISKTLVFPRMICEEI